MKTGTWEIPVIVQRFLVFFFMSAFIVTCSMILMLHGISPNNEELIRERAPLVFINVFVLSLILSVQDLLRRYYSEIIPARRIIAGVKAISEGDFSFRIKSFTGPGRARMYNPIIDGINTMAVELANTEMLRTDFISNVSHELKTPLSTISAYCVILQDPDISADERNRRIQTIMKTVRNLSDLVTDILRLNRIEHQQINSNRQQYDLSAQLVECVLGFEQKWEDKGLGFSADIDDDVMVAGDRELLAVVWTNLLSNAIKFTEKGGSITVCLKKRQEGIFISVSDTGCGMSEQTGKHIFDKFFQGDTSHATEGNGLGLSMVKKIVDLHDGAIEVKSIEGRGSTFTVRLDNP